MLRFWPCALGVCMLVFFVVSTRLFIRTWRQKLTISIWHVLSMRIWFDVSLNFRSRSKFELVFASCAIDTVILVLNSGRFFLFRAALFHVLFYIIKLFNVIKTFKWQPILCLGIWGQGDWRWGPCGWFWGPLIYVGTRISVNLWRERQSLKT